MQNCVSTQVKCKNLTFKIILYHVNYTDKKTSIYHIIKNVLLALLLSVAILKLYSYTAKYSVYL